MRHPDVIQIIRQARIVTGAELLARLQAARPTLSRATMMRMLKNLGDQIISGGAARSSSYAVRRLIRGAFQSYPLYQIDERGRGLLVGTLNPIYPNGCHFKPGPEFAWPIEPDWKGDWYAGLPYPLEDLRPQGFLGRLFARNSSAVFQVSDDPSRWSEDDLLAVLSVVESDASGNFILGEAAYRRFLKQMQEGLKVIAEDRLDQIYADMAEQSMRQGVPGSSAGGEFPKFTACRIKSGNPCHVIVKFSGSDQTPEVQRWKDLLVCEHLALESISALLPCRAAQSIVVQGTQRLFLEVQRFDRHGEFGRSPLCSWAAMASALFGMSGVSWIVGANRLFQEKLISESTRQHIIILWYFGKLIANSDMHEGNLSFRPSAQTGLFELAPAYDMLPMLYAPTRGVELQKKIFAPDLPTPEEVPYWLIAAGAARQLWECAAADPRIGADFRAICAANLDVLADAIKKID